MSENIVMVQVEDLKEGDMVDLSNDAYANSDGGNALLEYEYIEVSKCELETPECVVVYFEGFDAVGFPVHHRVPVVVAE